MGGDVVVVVLARVVVVVVVARVVVVVVVARVVVVVGVSGGYCPVVGCAVLVC